MPSRSKLAEIPAVQSIRLRISERLRSDSAYRNRFFRRHARDEIAMQIRALREKRGFKTQGDFGRQTGMTQSAVSRIENAEYESWTFKTLLRTAEGLNAQLRIRFEPAEEVIRRQEQAEGARRPLTQPKSGNNILG